MFFKFLIDHYSKLSDDEKYFKYFYKRKKLTQSKHGGGFTKLKLIYYSYKLYKISSLYNCSIPLTSDISEKPIFPHGLCGIFISSGATIGKKCVIFQHVTIGSNTLIDSKNKGVPTIGNNVYIGAGAKIIGNVKIGDNVRIGANTTITKDIPSNSTVVNGEIRIFKSDKVKNNEFLSLSDCIAQTTKN